MCKLDNEFEIPDENGNLLRCECEYECPDGEFYYQEQDCPCDDEIPQP